MKKIKCNECHFVHGGFHVCIDLSTPEPALVPPKKVRGKMSEENRMGISEAQLARWAKIREANAERDKQILERYREGDVGYMALAEEFEMNGSTMHKLLKRAADDGLIEMRPVGMNLGKKSRKTPDQN